MLLRSVLGVALATAGFLALSSCDSVPLTAPTESTITVYANPTTVALGGQATITATLFEKGGTSVQDGTQVTFTTTLGSVSPTETTTRGGKASVTFFAGSTSGTARVSAYSGAASGSGSTSGSGSGSGSTTTVSGGPGAYVDILIGGAAATKISVSASPATLPSTGGTSTILAIVTDDSGNRQTQVPVSFSTTAGTLSATSANTDSNGEARVQLTTTRAADVTATVGKAEGKVSVTLNGQLGISITPPTNIQTATPAFFTIGVTAPSGTVVRDVSVNWGDGSSTSLGALTGSTLVSHTYTIANNYLVTVTATDTSGDSSKSSTSVTVVPVQVNVTLTGPATGKVTETFTFTATVTPTTTTVSKYTFNWGDGVETENKVPATTTTSSHKYSAPSQYTVRVTVQTAAGEYTATAVILVNPS